MQKDIAERCLFCLRERIAVNSRPCAGYSPAWAGKSETGYIAIPLYRVQPRSCGEKKGARLHMYPPQGSSPLVRGKVAVSVIDILPDRDHPRSCGEKAQFFYAFFAPTGSSPLMRGKVANERKICNHARIIPAHAGKRRICLSCKRGERDHPRSCGEKGQLAADRLRRLGSSPLMRGKEIGQI